jgi:hypothetical protein
MKVVCANVFAYLYQREYEYHAQEGSGAKTGE